MCQFPFPHNGPVYVVADDRFEVAYYSLDYQKYKRVRELDRQSWGDTVPQEIDSDHFWMVVALVERKALA